MRDRSFALVTLAAVAVLAAAAPAVRPATAAPAAKAAAANAAHAAHAAEVVPFMDDSYTRAVAEARARNVPIFVEAWAPW